MTSDLPTPEERAKSYLYWSHTEDRPRAALGRRQTAGLPHCGCALFEFATPDDWWRRVDAHDAKFPGYRRFVEWCADNHHLGYREALKNYNRHTDTPLDKKAIGL